MVDSQLIKQLSWREKFFNIFASQNFNYLCIATNYDLHFFVTYSIYGADHTKNSSS